MENDNKINNKIEQKSFDNKLQKVSKCVRYLSHENLIQTERKVNVYVIKNTEKQTKNKKE